MLKSDKLSTRLQTVIDNINDAIMVENRNREIIFVNEMFLKLFAGGASREVLIGSNCENTAEDHKSSFQNPEKFVEGVNQCLKNRVPVYNQLICRKDGHMYYRDYVPIFIDNVYEGHLWKYHDITDKINTINETTAMVRKLQDQIKYDHMMVALFSHDLRQPYNGVTQLLELVDDNMDHGDIIVLLKSLKDTIVDVTSTMDDLISWVRSRELNTINITKFSLHSLAETSLELSNPRKLQLINNIPKNCQIKADYLICSVVIRNFVSNAMKFTEVGSVSIEFKKTSKYYIITIKDTGSGISHHKLKSILSKTVNSQNGLGIGLMICNDLAKRHRGKIKIQSKKHKGTTANLYIPKCFDPTES